MVEIDKTYLYWFSLFESKKAMKYDVLHDNLV